MPKKSNGNEYTRKVLDQKQSLLNLLNKESFSMQVWQHKKSQVDGEISKIKLKGELSAENKAALAEADRQIAEGVYFHQLRLLKSALITKLKTCDSKQSLATISSHYQRQIESHEKVELSENHKKQIEALDQQIISLYGQIRRQFLEPAQSIQPEKSSPVSEIPHSASLSPVEELTFNQERANKISKIVEKLKYLEGKIEDIQRYKEDTTKAVSEVQAIIDNLKQLNKDYVSEVINDKQYQDQAKNILSNDKITEISEFRGLKMKKVGELLLNILAAISTAFIGYGIAAAVKGDLFLFRLNTDTKNKVNAVDAEIKTAFAPGA